MIGLPARRLARRLRQWLRGPVVSEVEIVHRLLSGVVGADGVMMDVGAHHGGALEPFAVDGWSVHAFEPDPSNRARLESRWDRHPAVRIDARALSDLPAESAPFYRSPVSSGISSLTPFHATHERAASVAVTTVREYVKQAALERVDFLKIDAEGNDLRILMGVPWEQVPPDVVLCEFDAVKEEAAGYGYSEIADFLVEHGYRVLVSEWYPLERYGARHRWRRFFVYPAPLEDAAAWGNLIAVRETDLFDRLVRQTAGRRG